MQALLEQLQINPVIAAVGSEDALDEALRSECRVIFLLTGSVLDIGRLTDKVRQAGKFGVVHLDLIEGLSGKEMAVDAIQSFTSAQGVLSTRVVQIRRAKQLGLAAIQRGFMIDSRSVNSFENQIAQSKPDYVELLPAIVPQVIARLHERIPVPIIAGGLISEKSQVIAAIRAGALAVSVSDPSIWSL